MNIKIIISAPRPYFFVRLQPETEEFWFVIVPDMSCGDSERAMATV